ncbi:MAG: serine protease [Syntrophaceae bacterium]|nr:serine protease [Syntrophaceae bacterium]
MVKKIGPCILDVLTYDKEGSTLSHGRGFFVSKEGDVVTNRHLLEGASRAEIKTVDQMLYPVTRVVAEDKEADLIRLSVEVPPKAVHPLAMSAVLPQLGERVIMIDTSKPERSALGGVVSGLWETPTFGKGIQISKAPFPVTAGDPVISMNGQVVGVVISRTIEGHSFHFILPGKRVIRLKPGKGITLAEWEGMREETADIAYAEGLPFLWKEDYQKALLYFEKAAKKNPRYAEAYFQIGYCHAQLKQYVEAYEAYKQSVRIKPDFVLSHFFLGLLYLEVRDKNHAMEEYKILRDLDRDYASDLLRMIQ